MQEQKDNLHASTEVEIGLDIHALLEQNFEQIQRTQDRSLARMSRRISTGNPRVSLGTDDGFMIDTSSSSTIVNADDEMLKLNRSEAMRFLRQVMERGCVAVNEKIVGYRVSDNLSFEAIEADQATAINVRLEQIKVDGKKLYKLTIDTNKSDEVNSDRLLIKKIEKLVDLARQAVIDYNRSHPKQMLPVPVIHGASYYLEIADTSQSVMLNGFDLAQVVQNPDVQSLLMEILELANTTLSDSRVITDPISHRDGVSNLAMTFNRSNSNSPKMDPKMFRPEVLQADSIVAKCDPRVMISFRSDN